MVGRALIAACTDQIGKPCYGGCRKVSERIDDRGNIVEIHNAVGSGPDAANKVSDGIAPPWGGYPARRR